MSKNKTYYLVEKLLPGIDLRGRDVVALNPEACDELDNKGVPHSVINDFFSDGGVKNGSQEHFFDQIEWFKKFDTFLKNNIGYCRAYDLNIATAHYTPVKYLLDSCATYSSILESFFKAASPASIKFITDSAGDQTVFSVYEALRPRTSFYSRLIPLFCKKYGVSLEYIVPGRAGGDISGADKEPVKQRIKDLMLRLRLKSLQSFIRYKKYLRFATRKGSMRSKCILFLHTGRFPIDFVVTEALKEGARIFTMSKDLVFREGAWFQSISLDFSRPTDKGLMETVRGECLQAASKFGGENELLGWIDEKCGIAASEILLPYFKHFIGRICAEDLIKVDALSRFYDRENIDIVIVRSSHGRDAVVSLLAAKNRRGVKKICFEHSCTAFEQLSLLMTDVFFFDTYVTTDPLSEKYFKTRADNELFGRCRIVQSPHYLNSLKSPPLKKGRLYKDDRDIIIYAPNEASRGVHNLNIPTYEPNWYCQYLKRLFDHLGERRDRIFIFKYCPGFNWADRIIVSHLRSRKFDNIRLENDPLVRYLHKVDGIILDYPATGFFESAASGMPTMSLYKQDQPLWGGYRDFFGPLLQPFNNADDAIKHIDEFLTSDKSKYMITMPMEQPHIAQLFGDS